MIVLTTDNLLKKIEKGGYKYAKIFEGFLRSADEEKVHFERFECKTPDELNEEIKEFAATYSGKFTILLRKHNGGNDQTLCRSNWSTIEKVEVVQAEEVHQGGGGGLSMQDLEKFKNDWLLEMKREFEMKELQHQLKEKDAQLSEMQTNGGKLAYIGVEMLKAWGFGKGSPAASMQGAEGASASPEVNEENMKAAMNKIVKVFGAETIIKLANKVNEGDPIINMVRSFANS